LAQHHPPVSVTSLRRLPGAQLLREAYAFSGSIAEHHHDGVCLTIPLAGGFTAVSDAGETPIDGASAVLHPARRAHSAAISAEGLESISLHLDLAWLRGCGLTAALDRTRYWRGGKAGAGAAALCRRWMDSDLSESALRESTVRFLSVAAWEKPKREPRWLARIDDMLRSGGRFDVRNAARSLDLHPAWLLQAYRAVRGEGLHQTRRRRRVTMAMRLLRTSDLPLAAIAVQAGFCDQSHMNRSFAAVIGRTPLRVRADSLAQNAARPHPHPQRADQGCDRPCPNDGADCHPHQRIDAVPALGKDIWRC
jgi:AraC-like DNA-binding protein